MIPRSAYTPFLTDTVKNVTLGGTIILFLLIGLGYYMSLYVSTPILIIKDKNEKNIARKMDRRHKY